MSARILFAAGLILCSTGLSSAFSKAEPSAVDLYGSTAEYSILRDGLTVGRQIMTFAETDGRLEVTAEMTLEIRLFWIPVYEFSYRSREIWIDNSLTELTAQNIENDLEKSLSGQREGSNFLFKGPGEAGQIFGPVYPTNHWNADVLKQDTVLNTLTGSLNQVNITAEGQDQVKTEAGLVTATRYRYSGDLETEVWYDPEGRWVKMRFKAEDGSTITYQCQKCQGSRA